MRDIKNKLTTSGKGSTNIQSHRGKSFGYQVLGFGAGGGGAPFIEATGGTITCTGDYKIHTFTGDGTFCVSNAGTPAGSDTVDYMIVAGGGGGGSNRGGGGGAGGYRESPGTASGCYSVSPLGASPAVALPVSAQGYPISVGAAGSSAGRGGDSTFSTITSAGGAEGPSHSAGNPGGSGSGGGHTTTHAGGTGNQPPVSPPQGNNGGVGSSTSAAGGGGATAVGANAGGPGGAGGAGATSSINASPTTRGGGGGGGGHGGSGGCGGSGGGGQGRPGGGAGSTNTGGGGGGGTNPLPERNGYAGGSGIVIIRYKYQ